MLAAWVDVLIIVVEAVVGLGETVFVEVDVDVVGDGC